MTSGQQWDVKTIISETCGALFPSVLWCCWLGDREVVV